MTYARQASSDDREKLKVFAIASGVMAISVFSYTRIDYMLPIWVDIAAFPFVLAPGVFVWIRLAANTFPRHPDDAQFDVRGVNVAGGISLATMILAFWLSHAGNRHSEALSDSVLNVLYVLHAIGLLIMLTGLFVWTAMNVVAGRRKRRARTPIDVSPHEQA